MLEELMIYLYGRTAEVDGTLYEVPFGAGIVCGNGLMVFIWDQEHS
jgi:hypothetical protein